MFPDSIYSQTSKSLLSSIIITHDRNLYGNSSDILYDSTQISQSLRSSMTHSVPSIHLSPSKTTGNLTESNDNEVIPRTKTRLEILTEKIEELKNNIENQEERHQQLQILKNDQENLIEVKKEDLEKLKKDEKLKNQIMILLQNPEESRQKLIESLEVLTKKRENLRVKFEAHKEPLDEKLQSFSGVNSIKLQKSQEKLQEISSTKRIIEEIKEDMKIKIEIQKKLYEEINEMKRVTERSSYTSRIMDIVKNIKRQNKDIDEILKDTKTVQKAINTAEGQLQRQFTVTEDLIWNNVRHSHFNKILIILLKFLFYSCRHPNKMNIQKKLTNY